MIDLVYIFGRGSQWQNNELRYSLRSVQENLQWYHKVFLVGNGPNFLSDKVTQIPHLDIYQNKQRNIMAKIYRACNDERISENFILFNDDYFMLQPTDAVNYPYYFNTNLIDASAKYFNSYKKCIDATIKVLQAANKPLMHFDIHKPIVYNKTLFKEMCNSYDWNHPHGYIVKSMYCNHFSIVGEGANDLKINYPYKKETIYTMLENKGMFSVGDKGLGPDMKSFLNNLFPLKSKFEI